MEEKQKTIQSKAAFVWRVLVMYLEDLLLLASGALFVAAAAIQLGLSAALATAGLWLAIYAVVIAKAKRGGNGK